jgi:hypothetical protein
MAVLTPGMESQWPFHTPRGFCEVSVFVNALSFKKRLGFTPSRDGLGGTDDMILAPASEAAYRAEIITLQGKLLIVVLHLQKRQDQGKYGDDIQKVLDIIDNLNALLDRFGGTIEEESSMLLSATYYYGTGHVKHDSKVEYEKIKDFVATFEGIVRCLKSGDEYLEDHKLNLETAISDCYDHVIKWELNVNHDEKVDMSIDEKVDMSGDNETHLFNSGVKMHIEFLTTRDKQAEYINTLESDYNENLINFETRDAFSKRVKELLDVIELLREYPPTILIVCKKVLHDGSSSYIGGMGLWIINHHQHGKHYCCCLGLHKFRSLMQEEYFLDGNYKPEPIFNPALNVSLALIKTTIELAKCLNIYAIYLPRDCGRGPGRLWSKYGALYKDGKPTRSFDMAEPSMMSNRLANDPTLLDKWNEEYKEINAMIQNMRNVVPTGYSAGYAKYIFFVNNHTPAYNDIQELESHVSITKDDYPANNINELSQSSRGGVGVFSCNL